MVARSAFSILQVSFTTRCRSADRSNSELMSETSSRKAVSLIRIFSICSTYCWLCRAIAACLVISASRSRSSSVKRPRPLVEALHDADGLAGQRAHRDADDALGPVAGALVDARIEALVRIGIGGDDRLAGLEGVAGEAGGVEDADFVGQFALRNPRIEFGGCRGR